MNPITDKKAISDEMQRRLRQAEVIPATKCVDGFAVSIQASAFHYCLPRNNFGPWGYVELGFPTEIMRGFEGYAEDQDTTETVWARVPFDRVVDLLASHGGILPEKE